MERNKTKEEILNETIGDRSIIMSTKSKELCLEAMQTYADQQVALNGEWNRVEDIKPPFGEAFRVIITFGNGKMKEAHDVWIERTQCFDGFYCDYITHWQPIIFPGSNQGPTKVQLIETIAQRDQVIRDQEATISDLTPNSQQ